MNLRECNQQKKLEFERQERRKAFLDPTLRQLMDNGAVRTV